MAWNGTNIYTAKTVIVMDEQWFMLSRLIKSGYCHSPEDTEYWKRANDFLLSINDRLLSSLTEKQMEWFYDIIASLDWEIDKREGRIAWGLEKEDEDDGL